MVLVTGVEGIYRDFGTGEASLISSADPDELERLLGEGQFPAGTMGPKVEAAIQFVRTTGKPAVICQPAHLAEAVKGRAGTVVRSGEV